MCEGRDAERAHGTGEDDAGAGNGDDEVLGLLPRHRDGDGRRRQLHGRVDDVADRPGLELVVDLVGRVGIQMADHVGVSRLVEVGARLGTAVHGGQAETGRAAGELRVARREHDPPHGKAESRRPHRRTVAIATA